MTTVTHREIALATFKAQLIDAYIFTCKRKLLREFDQFDTQYKADLKRTLALPINSIQSTRFKRAQAIGELAFRTHIEIGRLSAKIDDIDAKLKSDIFRKWWLELRTTHQYAFFSFSHAMETANIIADHVEDQEDCPICLEKITQTTASLTSCNHVFCTPCIKQVRSRKMPCPLCRHMRVKIITIYGTTT